MAKIYLQLKDILHQRFFSLHVWWICHDSLYVSRNPIYSNMYHKHALCPKVCETWTRTLVSQIGAGHQMASETGFSKVAFLLKITIFSGPGALDYRCPWLLPWRKEDTGRQAILSTMYSRPLLAWPFISSFSERQLCKNKMKNSSSKICQEEPEEDGGKLTASAQTLGLRGCSTWGTSPLSTTSYWVDLSTSFAFSSIFKYYAFQAPATQFLLLIGVDDIAGYSCSSGITNFLNH